MKLMENTRLTKDQIDNLQHRLEGWLLELRAAVLEVARQGRQLWMNPLSMSPTVPSTAP